METAACNLFQMKGDNDWNDPCQNVDFDWQLDK